MIKLLKLWAAVTILGAISSAAQILPPTAPTVPAVAQPTVPAPPPLPNTPEHAPATRARVAYSGVILQITADNSSLNQILREVSRVTGMKISGGVAEERVFGVYGPGPTSAVLTTLLSGTGSNMLLTVDQNQKPTELLLTPRTGGSSPPSPSTFAHDDGGENPDLPPQLQPHISRPQIVPPAPPPPAQTINTQPTNQPTQPAASGTTTQQSPNGVKTPQQVYEELLKLQQQKKVQAPQ